MKSRFFWGLATSSCQIEGGYGEDGRVPSIWDVASDHVKNNETPHVACDFYHKYKEDIQLFRKIGINSFRLSIYWGRVIDESGRINQKGLDFYNNVINELIKHNIEPLITLYHWDLPLWIHKLGGWESEKIIPLFRKFAEVCAKEFGNKVTYWYVFNEPQQFLSNGYFEGGSAPFFKKTKEIARISLICMKAHKQAVEAIREFSKNEAKIGIALATAIYIPKTNDEVDIEKAKQKTFEGNGKLYNAWYSDPLVGNKAIALNDNQKISELDLKDVFTPLDFVGINYYGPSWDEDYVPLRERRSAMGWNIDERGMYWVCKFYYERYGLPILISENGTAESDVIEGGKIHDINRVDFVKNHIDYMLKAKNDGVDVIGYLYWSALDNFEWCEGYTPRFGMVYVDYKSQKRTLKDSAIEFKKIIEGN